MRSSWSKSLEDLVSETTQKQFRGRRPLAFAPRQVRNPRAYDKTPVVLVVASEATRDLQGPLFEALELMEKASGAFKVAVFAEAGSDALVRRFDWALEQCFSEAAWWSMSSRNWLTMAGERLEWAHTTYGASYVLAARSVSEAASELAAVGTFFGIEKLLISAAQAHVYHSSTNLDERSHSWMRGWMDDIQPGESMHRIEESSHTVFNLEVHKNASAPTLVGDGDTPEDLILEVKKRGWSVVLVKAETSGIHNQLELAIRKALNSALGSVLPVFQSFSTSLQGWDIALGSGALVSDPDGTWELVAGGGLRFEAGTASGSVRAAERLLTASTLVEVLN